MANNVEIKARLIDRAATARIAASISDEPVRVIVQRDTFFNCATGRLKLRDFGDNTGELISYCRHDSTGPTTSDYQILNTSEPQQLRAVLDMALGTRGEVNKTRHLYLVGNTRIHLDKVARLGHFLELEVVMGAEDDPSDGRARANHLMQILNVKEQDLISCAYIDLLSTLQEI